MNTTGGTRTTCQDYGKVFSDANAWSSFISFWPLLRNIKGDWDGRNLNLTRNSLLSPWSVRMVRWWKTTKWSWLAPVTNQPSTSLAGKECVERTEEYWLQNWVYALFLLATLYTSWTVWSIIILLGFNRTSAGFWTSTLTIHAKLSIWPIF